MHRLLALTVERERLDLEEIAWTSSTVFEVLEVYELDNLATPISGDAIAKL